MLVTRTPPGGGRHAGRDPGVGRRAPAPHARADREHRPRARTPEGRGLHGRRARRARRADRVRGGTARRAASPSCSVRRARGSAGSPGHACDLLVRLPMRGRVGSLNASASLAAALYAFVLPAGSARLVMRGTDRQRYPAGGSPLLGSPERRRSSGAEQLSCKQQVVGSNPTAGSSLPIRSIRSEGRACRCLDHAQHVPTPSRRRSPRVILVGSALAPSAAVAGPDPRDRLPGLPGLEHLEHAGRRAPGPRAERHLAPFGRRGVDGPASGLRAAVVRAPVRRRGASSREGTRPIHLRRRERPGPLPVRRANADRGRFGSARADRRARHVPAVRAVRRVVERRRPARGERRRLRPGLEPAPPATPGRPPTPPGSRSCPGLVRWDEVKAGQHHPRDPVHGLVHDGRVRLAGTPRGRRPRPRLSADGRALPAAGPTSTSAGSARGRGRSCARCSGTA